MMFCSDARARGSLPRWKRSPRLPRSGAGRCEARGLTAGLHLLVVCAAATIPAPGTCAADVPRSAASDESEGARAPQAVADATNFAANLSVADALRSAPLLRAGAWRDAPSSDDGELADLTAHEVKLPFGTRGTTYVEFGGFAGIGGDGLDEPVYAGSLTVARYIADGLSLGARLDLMAFDLEDDVSTAIGCGITFRWHLLERERWALFLDGGVGMMLATRSVPEEGGSRFNFTPELGFGFSFDMGKAWRVVSGVRWHHVSNARSWRSNPGRDGVVLFAGISVPF